MKQSGFDVSVLRYTDQNGFSLPEKLSIKSDDIRVKAESYKYWKSMIHILFESAFSLG